MGSEIAERKECMSGGGEIRLTHLDSEITIPNKSPDMSSEDSLLSLNDFGRCKSQLQLLKSITDLDDVHPSLLYLLVENAKIEQL